MFSRRFLLDFVVMLTALGSGPFLLRWLRATVPAPAWRWFRRAFLMGPVLLASGLVITLVCSFGVEQGYRWMLVSGIAFAWGVAVCCATVIGFLFHPNVSASVSPIRRNLLRGAVSAAMTAPAATLAYGMFIGRRAFTLKEIEIPMPGLPPDLEGLRLVQLSDIHLSPFLSRTDLAYCVDMANETRAQLAFVTGDLITGIRDSIDDCLAELRRLRADAGIYGCNGNHEQYVGAEAYLEHTAGHLGMHFLRQQQESLPFGSALLNIAGVDHQWRRDTYLKDALPLLRPGQTNLLLSHNPDVFPVASRQGWDLTLAGHMHGGQLNLEVMGTSYNLARTATPYVYGLYRQKRSAIYVTRGIGTIGMPVRVGAPPEVALLTLRRA